MEHKNTFTKSEIAEIKKLINEKVKSGTTAQKTVRDKIRKMYGFYWSDYSNSKPGYTVEDLQSLIDTNKVKVV
jgi:hypothetical protein